MTEPTDPTPVPDEEADSATEAPEKPGIWVRWKIHVLAIVLFVLLGVVVVFFWAYPRILAYVLLILVAGLSYGALYLIAAAWLDPKKRTENAQKRSQKRLPAPQTTSVEPDRAARNSNETSPASQSASSDGNPKKKTKTRSVKKTAGTRTVKNAQSTTSEKNDNADSPNKAKKTVAKKSRAKVSKKTGTTKRTSKTSKSP